MTRSLLALGNDLITMEELDEAIDAMPEWMRTAVEDPAQKRAFLEQYVAEELIYQKAKRLELDKDPSVRKQAERATRQLMIQKVLEDEIKAKVKISDDEVDLYYRAHPDRYGEKEAFKIRMMKVDADRLQRVRQALADGEAFAGLAKTYSSDEATRANGGEVGDWIEEGLDPTGMGDPNRLVAGPGGSTGRGTSPSRSGWTGKPISSRSLRTAPRGPSAWRRKEAGGRRISPGSGWKRRTRNSSGRHSRPQR